ncbi:ribosomal 5S rRNA E-loop binding protein Ctc/L25/TL5 [Parvibaculum lavamentivorans DS-1]|uniref:Large ribosomal subunit protein bL25 n=1 Tax=Parvibaculum lavamentivorans (strain DS-1 / DSM 13023 / NCIMB 13966) TaxID=402881 RepID=RL25_PARL1|nr:50S ribosomal protein L25/general stress protein Ctc [Parvibaculum lavamentivorans]A7HVD8.1 RecName: Full=Large ribosomal subunit protein bL25; AltName: Full=50S ribosomal protein L25; AltName: Full=General stress protein CTC [Parvibaculum lavamentivorans DS-1]ABS63871.1 ribosomal 5S rRNA E-loop binding protein Ctc/L25/TL5 [Parvibaculum lavamentivorans DS-1]
MAETQTLKAEAREKGSKGAVRSLRRAGRVPAVIYGDKQSPELIAVSYKDVSALYQTGTFMSHVLDVEIGGKTERVIPRDVQFEPVRDFIIHVDFLRLGKNATVTVDVPVHFHNHEASPGIKAGGVLNIVRHEVELVCPADAIPEQLDIDLTGFEMGSSIHISAVKLPAKVSPTITDRDFTIATIAAPAAVVSADNEAKTEEAGEDKSEEKSSGKED